MYSLNMWIRVTLRCTIIAAGMMRACYAQEGAAESAVRPEGRIVGKVWHTRLDFAQSIRFMQSAREKLNIPQPPLIQPPLIMMGDAGRSGMAMHALRRSGAVRVS
jgi:hypothetical protein